MFELKQYQRETLDWLTAYLDAVCVSDPQTAFAKIREINPRTERTPYQPLPGLEEVPYVCLRLPTGGGKTHLAARVIETASTYLQREKPLVLWMVPTNAIRQQTLATLRDHRHPNRKALDDAFGMSGVMVLDIADFTTLRPQDLRDRVVIIVTTMAVPRIGDTDLRKIYDHHEALEPHFVTVSDATPHMDRLESGGIKYSFRNLLALHHPMVIVDEAHNATSNLSMDVLQRIQPSLVVEFTATPATTSNILHAVTAEELKREEMIKLPIVLTQHATWQEAVQAAVDTRQKLATLAEHDEQFIHPIVLFQAEERGREVTFDILKNFLLEDLQISPERVAVATGKQHELDGIDLLNPLTQIDFVITIEALKEGWDCPFAYVFCSVATVHSKKDVEQILGRVLRMPYARRRAQSELNRAYAHVSAASWPQAVSQMEDHLVDMGFEPVEAETYIAPRLPLRVAEEGSLFSQVAGLAVLVTDTPELRSVAMQSPENITMRPPINGRALLELRGEVGDFLEQQIIASAHRDDRGPLERQLGVLRRQLQLMQKPHPTPILVPQLCLWVEGAWEVAEHSWFLDEGGWDLLAYPAELSESDFSIVETAATYEIDINGERLSTHYLGRQAALAGVASQDTWTSLQLERELDRRVYQPDIRQEVMLDFIHRILHHLTEVRRIDLDTLVERRFLLAKALIGKIETYRKQAFAEGYQHTLLSSEAVVEARADYGFKFDLQQYPAAWWYGGHYRFDKHFYPQVGELEASGEEFDCAVLLDQCELVETWVRNIVSHSGKSFRIPLASGYFYPDFVAQLKDGRVMVVEYKGKHLIEYDDEKRRIGDLWESKSSGKGLFWWAVQRDEHGRGISQQLRDKLGLSAK